LSTTKSYIFFFLLIILTLQPLGPAAPLANSHSTSPSYTPDGIRKGHKTENKVSQAISNILHSDSLVTSDALTTVNHVCPCSYGHNLTWKLTWTPVERMMMMPI